MGAKKSQIIFPHSSDNGTIIPHRTDDQSAQWRMKMQFSMTKREFLAEVKSNKTPATFKTYQSMLNRYERWLTAEGQPEADLEYALSVQTLTRFKYSLDKGIKKDGALLGQSIRGVMGPLKGLCVYLIRTGDMPADENPFARIEMPRKVSPIRLRVSDEEVLALMEGTERQRDPRQVALSRLVLSTLIHAGVRADEFQNIEISHLNLQQGTLEVRRGKGGKTRLLHPPREFWIAVKGWLPFRENLNCQHPYLFALGPRMRMNDESLRKHLEEIKAIAGLKDHNNIHPHRLRAWFATHMSEAGAPLDEIQKALGHENPQTTFIYLLDNGKGATAMSDFASFGPVGWGKAAASLPTSGKAVASLPASGKAAPTEAEDRKGLRRSTLAARRTGGRIPATR